MKTILRELARATLSAVIVVALGSAGIVVASGGGGSGNAYTSLTLSQFALTPSAQFFGVISDETGSGAVVGASGPTLQGTVTATGNVGIGGTLGVTGAQTNQGALTVAGNTALAGTLAVTGATAMVATLTITGSAANNGITVTGGSSSGSGILSTGGSSNGIGVDGNAGSGGTGIGIIGRASGATATGLYAQNLTGPALYVLGDTTSPVTTPMRIEPDNADPSGATNQGGLRVNGTGVLRIATVTGTPPVMQSVSNTGVLSTVASAGTNQGNATGLGSSADWVTVTGADATKGVTLPAGSVARCVRVMNRTVASVLNVYGDNAENDTINGGAADAVYAQAGGSSVVYCTTDGTAWLTY